jgi:hypothetical protein
VRVAEPLRHAGGRAVAAYEPVHADGGEGDRLLVSVAAQPDEHGMLIEQPDPASEGWTFSHASSACCTAWGTGTSRSRPPLPRTNRR